MLLKKKRKMTVNFLKALALFSRIVQSIAKSLHSDFSSELMMSTSILLKRSSSSFFQVFIVAICNKYVQLNLIFKDI